MNTRLVPRNPSFEAVVRASFARQAMMATLGARLDAVQPSEVHIGMAHSQSLTQQNGFMHAGAITSIADSACGYAAFTLAPPDSDVLAVEFKISLISPARAPAFVARARVLRSGRMLRIWSRRCCRRSSRAPSLRRRIRPDPRASICGRPKLADGAAELLQDVFGKDGNPGRLVHGVASSCRERRSSWK
jgi:uncharacterized protein (TIGR00369 family)